MEFATLSKVALASCGGDRSDGGRGLVCSADVVRKGEALLEVQLRRCWTLETALAHPALSDLATAGRDVSSADLLHLHLMLEASRGSESPMSAHLASLPSLAEVGLPLVWSEDELAELEGSEVHTECLKLRAEVSEDFRALQSSLEGGGKEQLLRDAGLGYADYLWARCIYWSRYMELTEHDGSSMMAMCPMLDMFNHSPTAEPGLFKLERQRGVVTVRAARDYTKGEQAFINYKSPAWNDQLLLSFGFALPHPQSAASVITLSLNVSAAQCKAHQQLLNIAEAEATQARLPLQHTVVHMPALEGAGQGTAEMIVRHRLLPDSPLPMALSGMTRIQHMSEATLQEDGQRSGGSAPGTQRLVASEELRVLCFLHELLSGKRAAFRSSVADDQRRLKTELPSRLRYALMLRLGERQVLGSALERCTSEMVRVVQSVMRGLVSCEGRCGCAMCTMAGTPWFHRLKSHSERLIELQLQVARLSKALTEKVPSGDLTQATVLVHLWMADALSEPARRKLIQCDGSWPWLEDIGASMKGGHQRLDYAALDKQAKSGHNPYLASYLSKMCVWGSWLIAQWALADAIQMADLSAIRQEWPRLRDEYACSVPNNEAIAVLARHQPLLEVGAGGGYWASLLHKMRVDIMAITSAKFSLEWNTVAGFEEGTPLYAVSHFAGLQEGGPQVVCQHADRTLVLMWSDYMGSGTFGLECVRNYTGKTLILVGEWHDWTLGSSTPGTPAHGQAFSLSMQQLVDKEYERVQTVALPNWPAHVDRLMVFKRRT